MIRLGLRLTLNGGREAATRLAVTAVAVALGVGLLLITMAGINALNAQYARAAWLSTGAVGPGPPAAGPVALAADPLWWLFNTDYFRKHGHLPGRCGSHRAELTGSARYPASAWPRAVLRLAGP